MAVKKKIFISVQQPGDDQSLFFRMWNLMSTESPLARRETETEMDAALGKVRQEVERYADQLRSQQTHIDEIKRLCHVPIG
jgi:hypothetical protein